MAYKLFLLTSTLSASRWIAMACETLMLEAAPMLVELCRSHPRSIRSPKGQMSQVWKTAVPRIVQAEPVKNNFLRESKKSSQFW